MRKFVVTWTEYHCVEINANSANAAQDRVFAIQRIKSTNKQLSVVSTKAIEVREAK